ncbi:MAG TPA: prepilin-type N-terminal cleavage/methylation domain-containing protein [Candidatus Saccharimonadales bacterium]|nr:prepilin-type N-terminal cleavage/methylation domain-containing protein [Candidatus Saccharimonadales bacterium]
MRAHEWKKLFSGRLEEGFSVIEVSLVVAIISVLIGLATVNLFKFQHTSQLSSALNSFLADTKEQQIKAMVGDTEGTGTFANYGVHFETNSYTLFRTSYGTSNFVISLPSNVSFTTTLPSSQLIYLQGSGEVSGFTSGQNTVTMRDTLDGSQKVITFNRYGVVTAVN